jgi:CRP-like cAMP-binding protein
MSDSGKKAIIALCGARSFFGEACLGDYRMRLATMVVECESTIVRFDLPLVNRALAGDPKFGRLMLSFIAGRSERMEEKIVDFIVASSEMRLARLLLLLAEAARAVPAKQELLACIVGTTRSRVNSFMMKFRKLERIPIVFMHSLHA